MAQPAAAKIVYTPATLSSSLQSRGYEPNHEPIRRPIAGPRHRYARGQEVRQALPAASECFPGARGFLIGLTYGRESEWVGMCGRSHAGFSRTESCVSVRHWAEGKVRLPKTLLVGWLLPRSISCAGI